VLPVVLQPRAFVGRRGEFEGFSGIVEHWERGKEGEFRDKGIQLKREREERKTDSSRVFRWEV
jgi:hypothetical protein